MGTDQTEPVRASEISSQADLVAGTDAGRIY